MDNILMLENVCKEYETFKLSDVNLKLPYGCIMGLIGENGAGKSTTMKLILGLLKLSGGDITLFGDKNIDDKYIREHIGVVFDETTFPSSLNVTEINTIMKHTYTTWNERYFFELVKRFDLPTKKVTIKDFSKGMKVKLSIIIALSHDSKLLILDEVTNGLDPVVKDSVLELFLEFISDGERSILISSHITSDLEKICDYITFIHKGEVLLSDEKDMLLDSYRKVKCSREQMEALPTQSVIGVKHSEFGSEALVLDDKIPLEILSERPTLEDIMLYFIRKTA